VGGGRTPVHKSERVKRGWAVVLLTCRQQGGGRNPEFFTSERVHPRKKKKEKTGEGRVSVNENVETTRKEFGKKIRSEFARRGSPIFGDMRRKKGPSEEATGLKNSQSSLL